MRKAAMTLNGLVAVFFVAFLAYTFVAKRHLEGLAREFVTEKTLHYSGPIVEMAAASLEMPLVQQALSDAQQAAILSEIDEYHQDPAAYIADLTRKQILARRPQPLNAVVEKVAFFKERIRSYYDGTLAALVADLRMFAASNLVAALIALRLAYRSRDKIQMSVVWFSLLMLVAVLYCSYLYADGLGFFRILFRMHLGWRYPVLIAVVLLGLYLDYGRVHLAYARPTEKLPQQSA
jgi:hypothetical protein